MTESPHRNGLKAENSDKIASDSRYLLISGNYLPDLLDAKAQYSYNLAARTGRFMRPVLIAERQISPILSNSNLILHCQLLLASKTDG